MTTKACPTCGKLLDDDRAYCPVCVLRAALEPGDAEAKAEEPEKPAFPAEDAANRPGDLRFGHYEIMVGDDGKPMELGSGAMGVTYKAIDVYIISPPP